MAVTRLYVPVSVSAMHDARLKDAGDEAELIFYRALQLAKQTESDGVLSRRQIEDLHRKPRVAAAALEALVREGLLRPCGAKYTIAGWSDWNESKQQSEARRERERVRKESYRARRGTDAGRDGGQDEDATGDVTVREGKGPNPTNPPNPPRGRSRTRTATADEDAVLDEWATAYPKRAIRARGDVKTLDLIRDAIALCGMETVLDAVWGIQWSPWHRGENADQTEYWTLVNALRHSRNGVGPQVEKMAALCHEHGGRGRRWAAGNGWRSGGNDE